MSFALSSEPPTDLSSSKRRPALVVSPDSFNDHLPDVVLVALTSNLAGEDVIGPLAGALCPRNTDGRAFGEVSMCGRH